MQLGWRAGGKFPNNYLVAVMKKFYFSALFVAITVTFWACANGPKVDDAELFKTRTGVIGVFRQPAFYCSEASPQYMVLGDSTVLVKPSYSEDQDNLFVTELQPGTATLRSYEYSCGEDKHKFVLDTTRKDGASGIVVPATGFCKTVVSFVEGDQLFSQNDDLLIITVRNSSFFYQGNEVTLSELESLLLSDYTAEKQIILQDDHAIKSAFDELTALLAKLSMPYTAE